LYFPFSLSFPIFFEARTAAFTYSSLPADAALSLFILVCLANVGISTRPAGELLITTVTASPRSHQLPAFKKNFVTLRAKAPFTAQQANPHRFADLDPEALHPRETFDIISLAKRIFNSRPSSTVTPASVYQPFCSLPPSLASPPSRTASQTAAMSGTDGTQDLLRRATQAMMSRLVLDFVAHGIAVSIPSLPLSTSFYRVPPLSGSRSS
jgi:hypothetical protein